MTTIPEQVYRLIQLLNRHGYSAYLVGGWVRDSLLGKDTHDFDLTTDAHPKDLLAVLQDQPCKVLPTGIKHGTLTVIDQGLSMEITTYRIEHVYKNHRKPTAVSFTDDLSADLARRDFTMNAITYHPDSGIIDPFHGQEDIKHKLIRCVGNSEARLKEDALRILRALRFAFVLHFTIDDALQAAIQKHAGLLSCISKERIQSEWNQMLMSDTDHLLQTLRDYRVLPYITAQISVIYEVTQESKYHLYDVFTHTDIALNHTKGCSLCEKLAVFFHDIGKAACKYIDAKGNAHFPHHARQSAVIANQALHELKYSKQTIKTVCRLISSHDDYIQADEKALRRLLAKLDMDYDLAFSLIRVQYADACAKNPHYAKAQIAELKKAEGMLNNLQNAHFSIKRSDLKINGHDLLKLNYQGKQIKEALEWLYQQVIDDPSRNQREHLLALLKQRKKTQP